MTRKIDDNSWWLRFLNQKDVENATIMAAIEMKSEVTPTIDLIGNHTRKSSYE